MAGWAAGGDFSFVSPVVKYVLFFFNMLFWVSAGGAGHPPPNPRAPIGTLPPGGLTGDPRDCPGPWTPLGHPPNPGGLSRDPSILGSPTLPIPGGLRDPPGTPPYRCGSGVRGPPSLATFRGAPPGGCPLLPPDLLLSPPPSPPFGVPQPFGGVIPPPKAGTRGGGSPTQVPSPPKRRPLGPILAPRRRQPPHPHPER